MSLSAKGGADAEGAPAATALGQRRTHRDACGPALSVHPALQAVREPRVDGKPRREMLPGGGRRRLRVRFARRRHGGKRQPGAMATVQRRRWRKRAHALATQRSAPRVRRSKARELLG